MKKISIVTALQTARSKGYAIGAFNIFNYLSAKAAVEAAEECGVPVILQTSVGTVKYFGTKHLYSMLEYLRDHAEVPVYLHLDHCTSAQFAKECVDAGWDSVMIDASKYSYEDNIRMTREVSDYAHLHHIYAEGELGTIEGVEEEVCAGESKLASYEECLDFVKNTGIDLFAPAIGTAHGTYHGQPDIKFQLVEQLGEKLTQPIVCHGGTGLSKDTFEKLITLGIAKVNVSTALKHAYIDGMKKYAVEHPEEYAPLKAEESIYNEVKAVVKEHIKIFAHIG